MQNQTTTQKTYLERLADLRTTNAEQAAEHTAKSVEWSNEADRQADIDRRWAGIGRN